MTDPTASPQHRREKRIRVRFRERYAGNPEARKLARRLALAKDANRQLTALRRAESAALTKRTHAAEALALKLGRDNDRLREANAWYKKGALSLSAERIARLLREEMDRLHAEEVQREADQANRR